MFFCRKSNTTRTCSKYLDCSLCLDAHILQEIKPTNTKHLSCKVNSTTFFLLVTLRLRDSVDGIHFCKMVSYSEIHYQCAACLSRYLTVPMCNCVTMCDCVCKRPQPPKWTIRPALSIDGRYLFALKLCSPENRRSYLVGFYSTILRLFGELYTLIAKASIYR